MTVKFLRDWKQWRAGAVGEFPDGMADALIRSKKAKQVREVEAETAAVNTKRWERARKR